MVSLFCYVQYLCQIVGLMLLIKPNGTAVEGESVTRRSHPDSDPGSWQGVVPVARLVWRGICPVACGWMFASAYHS